MGRTHRKPFEILHEDHTWMPWMWPTITGSEHVADAPVLTPADMLRLDAEAVPGCGQGSNRREQSLTKMYYLFEHISNKGEWRADDNMRITRIIKSLALRDSAHLARPFMEFMEFTMNLRGPSGNSSSSRRQGPFEFWQQALDETPRIRWLEEEDY